jgi:hypothetical protein
VRGNKAPGHASAAAAALPTVAAAAKASTRGESGLQHRLEDQRGVAPKPGQDVAQGLRDHVEDEDKDEDEEPRKGKAPMRHGHKGKGAQASRGQGQEDPDPPSSAAVTATATATAGDAILPPGFRLTDQNVREMDKLLGKFGWTWGFGQKQTHVYAPPGKPDLQLKGIDGVINYLVDVLKVPVSPLPRPAPSQVRNEELTLP